MTAFSGTPRADSGGPRAAWPAETSRVDAAVARLDAWLDTMRGKAGYGGPVAHWWQQSLAYTGVGLDWRYEGIIDGYLDLWRQGGDARWLDKACRAGDDLIFGQQEDGHYPASAFEINPATAGTPHEAACDAALLLLAGALRSAGRQGWQRCVAAAESNLRGFYVGKLWHSEARLIRDRPEGMAFVPNKAATASEAFFLLAGETGDSSWVERYALPTLEHVMTHQVGGAELLDGAIAQNSFGQRRVAKFFPIYISRCVPALVRAYNWTHEERYAAAAVRAVQFVFRWVRDDGSAPTVVYPDGRANWYPCWLAPLGDILRAADLVRPLGHHVDTRAMLDRLLTAQDESGGIQTAEGFDGQSRLRRPEGRDFRDLLHVAGWCDKAFRHLASRSSGILPGASSGRFEAECTFRGKAMRFLETPLLLEASHRGKARYRWRKGEPWLEVGAPEFWSR